MFDFVLLIIILIYTQIIFKLYTLSLKKIIEKFSALTLTKAKWWQSVKSINFLLLKIFFQVVSDFLLLYCRFKSTCLAKFFGFRNGFGNLLQDGASFHQLSQGMTK